MSSVSHRPAKRDLTKGSVTGHAMRMAVPMTIGIGAIISFSIADTYFIGKLGAQPLAAISYTIPVTTLFFNLIFGLAIAMSATVSRKIGAGLHDEVTKTATIGVMMAVIISALLAVLGYLLLNPLFRALGAGTDVMPLIRDYMCIWFAGAVFLSIPVVANAAIRGTGDAKWPAVIMVMVAIVNIILDPLLIFGMWGIPAMGIKGAAVASLIAYMIASVIALAILGMREKIFCLRYGFHAASWAQACKPLLVIAIPVSLANLITPVMTSIYTAILSGIGDEAVAGYGIASRFEAFALIPIMALAGGLAPLVGQSFGAGLQDRVAEALRKAISFAVIYGIFCGFFFYVTGDIMVRNFTDNVTIREYALLYVVFVPISFIGVNIFAVITSMMNATGMSRQALGLNLAKSFLIAVPLAILLISYYGVGGFVASVIFANMGGMALSLLYMRRIRCT